MSHYRVDPDRVIGVLAGVDDAGAEMAPAISGMTDAALDGEGLVVDGRRTLLAGWWAFLEERRSVPGRLARVVAAAASAVSAATVAIVTGDVDMGVSAAEAETRALTEWRFALPEGLGASAR
ncbi:MULTISPECIES: hypothetical protein [Microbacterium]|uniref:hypothetical protein n=1 Tax=Microbacterium TaxID=33882 RepID=UPI0034674182